MSIRDKLLDFKRRLSDRKMYSIVVVIIAAISIWGIYQYKHAASLRQELDNQYNRAFYDMSGYVKNVEVLLIKAMLTSSSDKTAMTLQEAWRQANLAQTNLGQLPISPNVLANTSKFLTQIGDFSYSLSNQSTQGKPLNDAQYKTIEQLHGYATSLENNLTTLQNELSTGRLKWGELSSKGTPLFKKASKKLPKKEFENIDKTFQSYPTLIYDGPFSDHISKAEPKGITGNQISINEAKQKVVDIFGKNRIKKIETSNNNKNSIKTYNFKVTFNNMPEDQNAIVDITQKGGHIFWMLFNRPSVSTKIKVDEAKKIGREFLSKHGYPDMVDTYYIKDDNSATINYAFKQDNIVVYPDLIKLKIALDNGEIIGIESKGYLYSHSKRNISAPKVEEKQARALISSKVKILSSGLAIIPTDYKTEIFTYEFKGTLNNKDFLFYINAQTGKEENILMIIDSPKGILTL